MSEERKIELLAMNVVFQICDTVVPDGIVGVKIRQDNNDMMIDFVHKLIKGFTAERVKKAQDELISILYRLANDLAEKDGMHGSGSISPYFGNAILIYQEYLRGDNYERIDVRKMGLPTIDKLEEKRTRKADE